MATARFLLANGLNICFFWFCELELANSTDQSARALRVTINQSEANLIQP